VVTPAGDDSIEIPSSATQLVVEILAQMARGNAVSLLASQSELTTQEAAALLQVSRPFLIQLLEAGEIPHRKVGTHRRVTVSDLLAYQQRTRQARLQALSDLTEQAQDLGMGY
jgi:excisionase family DNA binding protein